MAHCGEIVKNGTYDMKIMGSKTDVGIKENGHIDSIEKNSSFHHSISFVLLFVQFFGIMPIYGISRRNEQELQFKWKSLRVFYTFYVATGAFVSGVFVVLQFCISGLKLDKTGHIAFYFGNFLGIIIFLRIARNWCTIIRKFSELEISMKHYNRLPNLRRRFKMMILSTTFLALLEHTLFIVNAFSASVRECEHFYEQPLKIYYGIAFPHFFCTIEFSYWAAALVETANIWSTVVWNFTDIFLMVVSSGLAVRLKQIVDRLEASKSLHESFIREIREDYNKMWHLCRTVDEYIAPLVLVSYANNLYFICIQLYNSIKPRSGIIETVYFFYSFGFILGRTLAVSLYAAWINDESRRPLKALYFVPSEQYSAEVGRFIDQVTTSDIGITGSKFFTVSRSFMLQVAGTIVTIELMLMQFGPLLQSEGSPMYTGNVCIA